MDYERSDYIPPAVQIGYWPRTNMVRDLVAEIRPTGTAVVDVGCNAGHLLAMIGMPCWGYDIADSPLSVGLSQGHDVRKADITADTLELAPIVTISEVLEHLADPHAMVARLNQDPVTHVVASGPYKETEHDHYEQHTWAWDLDGFKALFETAGFTVITQRTVELHQALVAAR